MKKKVTAIALIVALLAIGVVGGTMAYFTDSKSAENTFTFGKVEISLTETSEASQDGSVLAGTAYDSTGKLETENGYDGSKFAGYKFTQVLPGLKYSKKPVVTVASDSSDCYLIATATVNSRSDLYTILDGTDADKGTWLSLVGEGKLVQGEMADTNKWTVTAGTTLPYNTNIYCNKLSKDGQDVYIVYSENATDDTITYTFLFAGAQKANASYALFDTIQIPTQLTQEQAKAMSSNSNSFNVTVKAYAVQASGFDNVYAAYTTAFETEAKATGITMPASN